MMAKNGNGKKRRYTRHHIVPSSRCEEQGIVNPDDPLNIVELPEEFHDRLHALFGNLTLEEMHCYLDLLFGEKRTKKRRRTRTELYHLQVKLQDESIKKAKRRKKKNGK